MWYVNVIVTLIWVMTIFPEIIKKGRPILVAIASMAWVAYSVWFAFLFTEDSHFLRALGGSALGLIGGWCWYHFIVIRQTGGTDGV